MNKQQTIALAAIFQSAKLVQQVAHEGSFNTSAAEHLYYALFQFDAPSAEAVYGGIEHLQVGIKTLEKELSTPDKTHMEVPHMVIAIMLLSKKLLKAQNRLQSIRQRLDEIEAKLELYNLTHANTLSALADLYKQHISDLSPKIMVKGEPLHLDNPDNQNRIRSLLLAGIRSAILWDQLGGSRFQLLFKRKQLLNSVRAL